MAHSHRPQWKAAQAVGTTFDRGYFSTHGVLSQQRSQLEHSGNRQIKFRSEKQLIEAAIHDESNDALPSGAGDHSDFTAAQKSEKESGEDMVKQSGTENSADAFDDKDDDVYSDSDDESTDEEDDDEAEIAKELARIRKQRLESANMNDKEMNSEAELSVYSTDNDEASGVGRLKRRWGADVVFRNQAKLDKKQPTRFVNDTNRNDFHRRFLNRYMK